MSGEWEAGVVEETHGEEPPSVEFWRPASVPGRATDLADVDGAIAYRRSFDGERLRAAERVFLECNGLYASGQVWINGEYRGRHRTHFTPARFEFDPAAENEVLVVCERPETAHGIYATDAVPSGFDVPGIWWGVDLLTRPRTFLSRLSLQPRLGEDGAFIDVEVDVDAGEAIEDAITLSLRPEGFRGGGTMERMAVEAPAGGRVTVTKTLEIRDPKLWWPRTLGPQHRYTVRAKLGDDAIERTTGLCHVQRDESGLSINGRTVPAYGLTRLPGGDPHDDVERALDANATIVRARGHVPPRTFHEACDEAGLLVWQDLPTNGRDVDVDRGREQARALVETYGHHPSLALVSVAEDPTDPFGKSSIGAGRLSRLRFRWRCWRAGRDRDDVDAVAATLPDSTVTVPLVGPPGIDPDATVLAPGWRYLDAEAVDWLLERYPALGGTVGAIESGSLASEERDDVPGLDRTLVDRHATDAAQSLQYQATSVKTVLESLRRHECPIVAGPAIRDVAPGGGTGILTADGERKPAFDAVRQSLEPVQALLVGQPAPGSSIDVILVNDSNERVETTVTWAAGGERGAIDVAAAPGERVEADTVTIPGDADRLSLELAVDDRTVGNVYDLSKSLGS